MLGRLLICFVLAVSHSLQSNIIHLLFLTQVLLKRVWTSSKCIHTLVVLFDMITNPLRLMVPAPWAGFCFFKVHCHNKSLETRVKRQTLRPRTVFNRLRHDAVDSLPFCFLAEMLIFLYAPLWHVFQEIHECICGFVCLYGSGARFELFPVCTCACPDWFSSLFCLGLCFLPFGLPYSRLMSAHAWVFTIA